MQSPGHTTSNTLIEGMWRSVFECYIDAFTVELHRIFGKTRKVDVPDKFRANRKVAVRFAPDVKTTSSSSLELRARRMTPNRWHEMALSGTEFKNPRLAPSAFLGPGTSRPGRAMRRKS